MKKTTTMILLIGLSLAIGAAASAAESRSALRKEMVKAEDAYYALYNKLNTVREYDVICRKERPTGTNFPVRTCAARFTENARQANATDMLQAASLSADSGASANRGGAPNVGNTVAASASRDTGSKQEGLRRNLMEVLEKSPELQELARKRDALQARFDAVK
jgi:hypothetical protein